MRDGDARVGRERRGSAERETDAPPTLHATVDSPLGPLLLAGDGASLQRIAFPRDGRAVAPEPSWRESPADFDEARRQLAAYFGGELRAFELPLAPRGTAFQHRVWRALTTIGFGETIGYGALAARLGAPTASRAVGAANGANPLPIVLPCHRVVGADGSLTGFGGGLATKRRLLAMEAEALGASSATDTGQLRLL